MNRAVSALALVCVSLFSAVAAAQEVRLSPDQQREFLRKAAIVSSRPIGKGVTGSSRLTLSDGKLTHDAAFQTIDDRTTEAQRREGRRRAGEINFVDSYKYNIGAYEIARLLGLDDMMPVTVERRWRRELGSLTWWVDDVLMDEAERERTATQPPSAVALHRQRVRMSTFAELVGDTDRNKGNILYTKDWRVIMIDFTRAFRTDARLRSPAALTLIDRPFWTRLQSLTRDDVRRVAGSFLTAGEINAVMTRRDLIVSHFSSLIKERGEGVVVY